MNQSATNSFVELGGKISDLTKSIKNAIVLGKSECEILGIKFHLTHCEEAISINGEYGFELKSFKEVYNEIDKCFYFPLLKNPIKKHHREYFAEYIIHCVKRGW